MIITYDMLLQAKASQFLLIRFNMYFPNGLDFSCKTYSIPSVFLNDIVEIAKYVNHTGLFSCINLLDSDEICQLNFVNGKLEDVPNGNPAYVSYNTKIQMPTYLKFYKAGALHNSIYPAVIKYYPSGTIREVQFYRFGNLCAPWYGFPCFIMYDAQGKITNSHS